MVVRVVRRAAAVEYFIFGKECVVVMLSLRPSSCDPLDGMDLSSG